MVVEDLINTDDKPAVLRSLLLRHRHVNEHQSGFPFTKRKYNSYTSLQVCTRESECLDVCVSFTFIIINCPICCAIYIYIHTYFTS